MLHILILVAYIVTALPVILMAFLVLFLEKEFMRGIRRIDLSNLKWLIFSRQALIHFFTYLIRTCIICISFPGWDFEIGISRRRAILQSDNDLKWELCWIWCASTCQHSRNAIPIWLWRSKSLRFVSKYPWILKISENIRCKAIFLRKYRDSIEKKPLKPISRSSHPEVFLEKGVLKICCKIRGEHPCRCVTLIKLLCSFIETILRHGCSPVNLLHIFRKPFLKNTSRRLYPYLQQTRNEIYSDI